MSFQVFILLTFFLGMVPPFVWLFFWLREDKNPEPRSEIALVFLAGAASVIFAILLEHAFALLSLLLSNFLGFGGITFGEALQKFSFQSAFGKDLEILQVLNILGIAFIEEIAKMSAAFFTALRSKYFDEPVDAMIYLVAAAMGFATLENALFIADSLTKGGVDQAILVSAFRFINAVLLHASTVMLIGAGFAFSFFHHEKRKKELVIGIVLATLLHAAYDFFILSSKDSLGSISGQFVATALVMLGAAVGLVLFERARRIIES